ncbi:MAG: MarR family transcriptional regulator [Thermoleophilaceae bacterium]|nr:MarR family transcriptional regulator [Thermoleophilaceae bacterium]
MVARRLGAPPVEFKAMDHLQEAGQLTPGQLADRLALSSGAVTALIDRLERLGWAERGPHPRDRRSLIVRKAAGADTEAMKLYGPLARGLSAAAGQMSPAERDAASRFLEEAAAVARSKADELKESPRAQRGSGPAPTERPGPGSPPTPAA